MMTLSFNKVDRVEGLGKSTMFSRSYDGDDLLIEALSPIEAQQGEYRRIAFRASYIDYLFESDEKISGIVLRSGVAIPVALPFAELKRTIYEPDFRTGSSIDLSLVTGAAVAEAKKVVLSKDFNPAAESVSAEKLQKDIDIRLFAHFESTDRHFYHATFKESQIQYFEPHQERKETEIYIKLKNGHAVNGRNAFWAPVPMTTFTHWLSSTKQQGRNLIDFSDVTRPKSDKNYKM